VSLTITSAPTDELISLEEAKRHLRVMQDSLDDEVVEKLKAARAWCESQCSRTLRGAVTRTIAMSGWWCGTIDLPYPPALAISTVKYYADGVDTTLSAANYRLIASTDGLGHVEWTAEAELPSADTRSDSVRLSYTAGYTELPPTAKVAILMAITMLWGDAKGADLAASERAAKNLLNACEWGCYR